MLQNGNNYISHINYFLLIILIIFPMFKLSKNNPSKNISINPIRNLISGNDIVKQINEQCLENTNILKYNIIMNATAFLLNFNISSKRNLLSSIKDLDGKNIGAERGKDYEDLIKNNFPLSNIDYEDSTDKLILSLLQGKIDAFLLDEPVAKYYENQYIYITYLRDKLSNNQYGFGFSPNTNNKIKNEFNEYIAAIKKDGSFDSLLQRWTGEFNSLKTIAKELNGKKGVIRAAFNTEVPPFCYIEDEEIIGFEVDLLYRFAKLYDYTIELKSLTTQEQTKDIVNNNIDLIGGCISITEQKKLYMNFSTVIYEGGTVAVIRNETITKEPSKASSENKIIIKNQHGVQNLGNILNFPVTGLPDGQYHAGTCVFPENLTEIYSFECSISGLNENNPMVNGFTYGLITDYIEINGIILKQIYSYIPSHILGQNINNEIEHPGTMCPRMNVYLAGVDNIEEILNTVSLEFGIYRKSIKIPTTQANLYIRKGSSSCEASCQEKTNNIFLNSLTVLVRYTCSCSLPSASNANYFNADFDSIKFSYLDDIRKNINMGIQNKEMTKSAMSNLYKNTAKFPNDLSNLNTFLATSLINGRCIDGRFTFNAIGVLYKSISQEQFFTTNNPIRANFILKIPYDLQEAEIQISINAKVRGVLMIHKDYYENENNRGEYLYLTSKDDININALYCEGYTASDTNQTIQNRNNTTIEKVETVALRDEMGMPKWLIILLVLLIAAIVMMCIYSKINNMDDDVEYVIKYNKTNNTSVNNNPELPNK